MVSVNSNYGNVQQWMNMRQLNNGNIKKYNKVYEENADKRKTLKKFVEEHPDMVARKLNQEINKGNGNKFDTYL